MPGGVYGADAEEYIVLADVEFERKRGAGTLGVGPKCVGGVAPKHLIGRPRGREGGSRPLQLASVIERAGEHAHIARFAGGRSERSQGERVEPRDVRDISRVDEL